MWIGAYTSPATTGVPTITTTSLPSATQGSAYSTQLAVIGNNGPVAWSIVSGSLPAGVTLGQFTGVIAGTPPASGTFNITVQLVDSLNQVAVSNPLSLVVVSSGTSVAPPAAIFQGYTQANAALIGLWPDPLDTGVNGYTYQFQNNGVAIPGANAVVNTVSSAARTPALWYVATGLTANTVNSFTATASVGGNTSAPTSPLLVTTLPNTVATTGPIAPTDPATWLPTLAGFTLPQESATPTGQYFRATLTGTANVLTAGTGNRGSQNCGIQYAINNASLGDVIIASAGGVYSSGNGNGAIVLGNTTAGNAPPTGAPGAVLYIVSSQCAELGGALPHCWVMPTMYPKQVITFTAPIAGGGYHGGATSAVLTAPWTGRTGWFPVRFTPAYTTVGDLVTLTATPIAGSTSGTILNFNGGGNVWPNPTTYVNVKCTTAGGSPEGPGGLFRVMLLTFNSSAVSWIQITQTNDFGAPTFKTLGNAQADVLVLFTNNSANVSWTAPLSISATVNAIVIPGNYVTPADAGYGVNGTAFDGAGNPLANNMPTIQLGSNSNNGSYFPAGCNNIRFIGCNFAPIPSHTASGAFWNFQTVQASAASPITAPVTDILFDRCLAGNDSANWGATPQTNTGTFSVIRHAFTGQGNYTAWHQCFFWDLADLSTDSSCLGIFSGGPWCAQNSYFSAASESILHAGVFVPAPSVLPLAHDGVYRWSYSIKPDQWRLNHIGDWVKNHWEWKCGNRFEAYGSWLSGGWFGSAGQQNGRATGSNARDQNSAQRLPLGGLVSATLTAGSATITSATPHGLYASVSGQPCIITFAAGTNFGTVTGFSTGVGYFVIAAGLAASTFELSATQGGAAIVPGGSGTVVVTGTPNGINQISPWINISDINVHDHVMLNCGQMASPGTSDNSPYVSASTHRFANNLVALNPNFGGSSSCPPSNGWGIEPLGPVPNIILDRNTFIINPAVTANTQTASVMMVNGAWCAPSGNGWLVSTPNLMEPFSIRWTITNNFMDGTNAIFGNSFTTSTFLTGIDQNTLTIGNNAFILDAHPYPVLGTGTSANSVVPSNSYANMGCKVTPNNALAPNDPGDWNVISGTYATSSTSGGPIGCNFQPAINGTWWAANSPFNVPIPAGAFANPMSNSAAVINAYTTAGGNIITSFNLASSTFTACLIIAPAGQATTTWTFTYNGASHTFSQIPATGATLVQLQSAAASFQANGDSDRSICLYSTDTNLMYDIYPDSSSSCAAFTGTVSGSTLTVSGVIGAIAIGHHLSGAGVPAGVTITGGSGTSWTLSASFTAGPEGMSTSSVLPLAITTASVRPLSGSGWWNQANFTTLSSGTASGADQVGGSIKPSEWNAGVINHALMGAYPSTLTGGNSSSPDSTFSMIFPARGGDGTASSGTTFLPEGARLQLDPSMTDAQLTALGVPTAMLPVCHAMQTYGWYCMDKDGTFPAQIKFLSTNQFGDPAFNGPYTGAANMPLALMSHVKWIPGPYLVGSSGLGTGVSVTGTAGQCAYTTNYGSGDGLVHVGDTMIVYPAFQFSTTPGTGGLQFFAPGGATGTRQWWAGVAYRVSAATATTFTLTTLNRQPITSTMGTMNVYFTTTAPLDSLDTAIPTGFMTS